MARAAFLLKAYGDDITVKEVSNRVGFCSCDYFIRKFRAYYGIVPGRYKEYKTWRSQVSNRGNGFKENISIKGD